MKESIEISDVFLIGSFIIDVEAVINPNDQLVSFTSTSDIEIPWLFSSIQYIVLENIKKSLNDYFVILAKDLCK